jgi:hypothetical protein
MSEGTSMSMPTSQDSVEPGKDESCRIVKENGQGLDAPLCLVNSRNAILRL